MSVTELLNVFLRLDIIDVNRFIDHHGGWWNTVLVQEEFNNRWKYKEA